MNPETMFLLFFASLGVFGSIFLGLYVVPKLEKEKTKSNVQKTA